MVGACSRSRRVTSSSLSSSNLLRTNYFKIIIFFIGKQKKKKVDQLKGSFFFHFQSTTAYYCLNFFIFQIRQNSLVEQKCCENAHSDLKVRCTFFLSFNQTHTTAKMGCGTTQRKHSQDLLFVRWFKPVTTCFIITVCLLTSSFLATPTMVEGICDYSLTVNSRDPIILSGRTDQKRQTGWSSQQKNFDSKRLT